MATPRVLRSSRERSAIHRDRTRGAADVRVPLPNPLPSSRRGRRLAHAEPARRAQLDQRRDGDRAPGLFRCGLRTDEHAGDRAAGRGACVLRRARHSRSGDPVRGRRAGRAGLGVPGLSRRRVPPDAPLSPADREPRAGAGVRRRLRLHARSPRGPTICSGEASPTTAPASCPQPSPPAP